MTHASPIATHLPVVAVIDGNPSQRQQFATALRTLYSVAEFPDVETAVAMLRTPPNVIVIDEKVRPNGRRQLIQSIRSEIALGGAPVIVCRARFVAKGLVDRIPDAEPDAVLHKPFRRSELVEVISRLVNAKIEERWSALPARPRLGLQVSLRAFNRLTALVERGEALSQEMLGAACTPLVESVLNSEYKDILGAVRGHDNHTYVHSLRVAVLLTLLGNAMGLKDGQLLVLAAGGLVHDIGKTSIARDALNKPGKLSADEISLMQGHVQAGVEYLRRNSNVPKGVMQIAAQHHEKLDGSGYPGGLSGSQLNDLTRMATIVDVFTAMTDHRPYKRPLGAEQALQRMTDEMKGQLDSKLLNLFKQQLLDAVEARGA